MANNQFEVSVIDHNESSGTTYLVRCINRALPHSFWGGAENPGYMTPHKFDIREHAVHTAAEYAAFLGVEPEEKCTCIMCVHGHKQWEKK